VGILLFFSQLCAQKVHSEPVFALHARESPKGLGVVSGGGDNLLTRSQLTANVLTTTDSITLQHPGTLIYAKFIHLSFLRCMHLHT